ncbi:MAG: hypothetical protein BJ554DRAFT_343 [Olpidium bornovanus]|uniref:Uncharacterized protein n=1 Tax=Olpidium bornovanus TaxID=278681 RepID=A0A8H7ZUA9_9FUNG|nr:MAG: hypothetical protein BJ554DRAFT_343 [Olpidium bornovanus]
MTAAAPGQPRLLNFRLFDYSAPNIGDVTYIRCYAKARLREKKKQPEARGVAEAPVPAIFLYIQSSPYGPLCVFSIPCPFPLLSQVLASYAAAPLHSIFVTGTDIV